jgi:hypothetical protein
MATTYNLTPDSAAVAESASNVTFTVTRVGSDETLKQKKYIGEVHNG